MPTLVIVSFLFGAALGQIFKWPALYLATLLAIVLVLVKAVVQLEGSPLGLLLHVFAVTTSLQLGYAGGGFAASCFRYTSIRRTWEPRDRGENLPSTVETSNGICWHQAETLHTEERSRQTASLRSRKLIISASFSDALQHESAGLSKYTGGLLRRR
jgi:type III secretory pathway component EscS